MLSDIALLLFVRVSNTYDDNGELDAYPRVMSRTELCRLRVAIHNNISLFFCKSGWQARKFSVPRSEKFLFLGWV